MRIAVLFYGRLNKCVEHYSNIIESIGKENHIDFFLSSDNSKEELLNEFIHLYKPVSYNNNKIQYNCDLGNYPDRPGETNIHNMTCHFINKGRVLHLLKKYIVKENINYDVVISLRIDLVFHNKIIFENIEDNTIYIPAGNDYGGINDHIAYGNIKVMTKYNSIFSNAMNLLEKRLSIPHPESLTYANINFYNLIIKRFDISYIIER
jgi:hypothetical protein